MNKRIKDQLLKIKSTSINFKDDDTKIFIPKTEISKDIIPEIGKVYLIELSDEVLNPSPSSTLASNWNNGKIPTHKNYYAELVKIINNMYQWNCTSVDNPQDSFFGYIPISNFEIKEML